MCTVTVFPFGCGRDVRVLCNRDEQRARAHCREVADRADGGLRAIMPIDPQSGGSWIGVNDAGLAAVILNVNPSEPIHAGRCSRGGLVPRALACGSIDKALRVLGDLDAGAYAPFRLILVQRGMWAEALGDGRSSRAESPRRVAEPLMWTSSGLGDALVAEPRRRLFEAMLAEGGRGLETQRAFHEHRWSDASHLSVLMARKDARTVSHSGITLGEASVSFDYVPLGETLHEESVPIKRHLRLAKEAATA